MAKRSWLTSAREVFGSGWGLVGATSGVVALLGGAYQHFLVPVGFPAVKGPIALEPWHFWLFGYVVLFLTAVSSYHKVARKADSLTEQLDERWRQTRRDFEECYREYRDELDHFLTTLKNLFIQENKRQLIGTWGEHLPDPTVIDEELYGLAWELWDHGWTMLKDEGSLKALKKRFRIVYGFFDKVHDLQQDFPDHAPAYVRDRIKAYQYDALHVVWYFAHALGDTTFGKSKAARYNPVPQWDRLWREWNPGMAIPVGPREALEAAGSALALLPVASPMQGQLDVHVAQFMAILDDEPNADDELLAIPFALLTTLEVTNRTGQPMSIDPHCRISLQHPSRMGREWIEVSPLWTDREGKKLHDDMVEVPAHKTSPVRWTWGIDELALRICHGIQNVSTDGHILTLTDRVTGLQDQIPFRIFGFPDSPLAPDSGAPDLRAADS